LLGELILVAVRVFDTLVYGRRMNRPVLMPLPSVRRIWIMLKRYPAEQRQRVTRMALDRLGEYSSPWAAAQALPPKLGVGAETVRRWIVQAQVDAGNRPGPSSMELAEIKALNKENAEPREANEILKAATISSPGSSTLATVDLRVYRPAAGGRSRGRADVPGPA
jgi:transposase